MVSRWDLLDEDLADKILKYCGQDSPQGVAFSTEGSTVTSNLADTVVLVLSKTNIEQAHKQDKEYIAIDTLSAQYELFQKVLPLVLSSPVKR